MKALWFVPILLASAAAHADGTRSLVPAEHASKPVSTGTSDTDCNGGTLVVSERVIAKVRVSVVHDCGISDESGVMVLQIGGDYFASKPLRIKFHPQDGLEPAMFQDLIADRIYPGSLAGQQPAVLRAVTTRDEHHTMANRSIDSRTITMHVQACSLGPAAACAEIGDYVCGATSCPAPSLKNGVVRVVDGARKIDETSLVGESSAHL